MTVVLVERNDAARRAVEQLLRGLGAEAAFSFSRPEIAFLFLLGRSREVDAVVVNEDDEGAAALLQRLGMVPAGPRTVTYSGRRLESAARLDLAARLATLPSP